VHVLPSLEAVETIFFQLLILVGLIAVAGLFARRLPDLRTVAIVLGSLALAHLVIFTNVLPPGAFNLRWPWAGKILSIVVTLGLIAVIPSLSWNAVGFRWNQNRGVLPALIAAAITCIFYWSIIYLAHAHRPPTAETLWYQALIPGPNEEPLYRGLALVLLDRAFGNHYRQIFGAPFGFGAIITSIWFGIIHGVAIAGGHVVADGLVIFSAGTVGAFLAWIRMRTGSLVIPIITHAAVDVGDYVVA
jgi:uncharacterized protein